jgi:hypothetical protein
MSARLTRVFGRSERMVGRRVATEYVLVPLAGRGADLDSILNLNRVGAFIWEHLDGRRSGEEVVDALVARFDVERPQAARDYLEFLEQLEGVKAVVPVEPGFPR